MTLSHIHAYVRNNDTIPIKCCIIIGQIGIETGSVKIALAYTRIKCIMWRCKAINSSLGTLKNAAVA